MSNNINLNNKKLETTENFFWNEEEDSLLFYLVTNFGNKWRFFTSFFPSRTYHGIKNRWHYYHSKILGINLNKKNKKKNLNNFNNNLCLNEIDLKSIFEDINEETFNELI